MKMAFLQICKWYKLVVFTASVQEYADPVIDWLEQDRKYFIGRYYRQHCTFRSGNYIKDLSSVEPDLSKVMIVDNSPASYVFHPGTFSPCPFFFFTYLSFNHFRVLYLVVSLSIVPCLVSGSLSINRFCVLCLLVSINHFRVWCLSVFSLNQTPYISILLSDASQQTMPSQSKAGSTIPPITTCCI